MPSGRPNGLLIVNVETCLEWIPGWRKPFLLPDLAQNYSSHPAIAVLPGLQDSSAAMNCAINCGQITYSLFQNGPLFYRFFKKEMLRIIESNPEIVFIRKYWIPFGVFMTLSVSSVIIRRMNNSIKSI
jgi:hypothetical protein